MTDLAGEPPTIMRPQTHLQVGQADRAGSPHPAPPTGEGEGLWYPAPTRCGDLLLVWGTRTYVMGIVNVTPDSFSGDGLLDPAQAIAHGVHLAEQGADILDVGGESSRPGSNPVGAETERRRVIPVIEGLRQRVSVPISIDTYRAEVAEAALAAGAAMVNDVWGFRRDPALGAVVARWGVPCVAMHNRTGRVATAPGLGGFFPDVEYGDLLVDVARGLQGSIEILTAAGAATDSIIVDPGLGFGKTPAQNLQLLGRLGELRALGQPVLIGPSRKSFVGLSLSLPPAERVEGTAATVAIGILRGADIVRVHDLPAMARVARMADALVRETPSPPGRGLG